jgi:hypothetical protein
VRRSYNLAIPNVILNSVSRASRSASSPRLAARVVVLILGLAIAAHATDWSAPEQELSRKIAALTGKGSVSLTFENRSSIGRRDSEIIQNGLRSAFETMGVHVAQNEQAPAAVTISFSEDLNFYVWVAQVRHGTSEAAVVMVSVPRPAGTIPARDFVPLSLRKTSLWKQANPILDVLVLEENATPTRIAVLDPEKVSLYRLQGGNWQPEQALEIAHARPWPRDLRGRLIPARDHLLDAYLPGVVCHSSAVASLTLNCHEGDDPWPLTAPAANNTAFPGVGSPSGSSSPIVPTYAFFAPSRNFFTGALTPGGKFTTVSKFYSAALLQRDKNPLWLFAAVDGQVHFFDGATDRALQQKWGSDLTSVRTACGAGWQILATSAVEDGPDSLRAYEVPDRDPVAVTVAVDFPGAITALWTEARSDTAVAVARDQETGNYEAFRLAMACSQ